MPEDSETSGTTHHVQGTSGDAWLSCAKEPGVFYISLRAVLIGKCDAVKVGILYGRFIPTFQFPVDGLGDLPDFGAVDRRAVYSITERCYVNACLVCHVFPRPAELHTVVVYSHTNPQVVFMHKAYNKTVRLSMMVAETVRDLPRVVEPCL